MAPESSPGRPDTTARRSGGRNDTPTSRYSPLTGRLPFERTREPAPPGPWRGAFLALAGAIIALVVGVSVWLGPWFDSAGKVRTVRSAPGPVTRAVSRPLLRQRSADPLGKRAGRYPR
ncbi:hypothetical protein GCM10009603_55360 [Nocardiopsis exhalans]